MNEEFAIEYEDSSGRRLRIRYTPRGFDCGHWRVVEQRVGLSWDTLSKEPVADLESVTTGML